MTRGYTHALTLQSSLDQRYNSPSGSFVSPSVIIYISSPDNYIAAQFNLNLESSVPPDHQQLPCSRCFGHVLALLALCRNLGGTGSSRSLSTWYFRGGSALLRYQSVITFPARGRIRVPSFPGGRKKQLNSGLLRLPSLDSSLGRFG
jgi:hypothetical protein